jgi:hypothetical protein
MRSDFYLPLGLLFLARRITARHKKVTELEKNKLMVLVVVTCSCFCLGFHDVARVACGAINCGMLWNKRESALVDALVFSSVVHDDMERAILISATAVAFLTPWDAASLGMFFITLGVAALDLFAAPQRIYGAYLAASALLGLYLLGVTVGVAIVRLRAIGGVNHSRK